MRHRLFALLPILGALMTAIPAAAEPVAPADRAAVLGVLGRNLEAWNRHDMDAYVAEMTPDVDWVNIVGMHWRGRDTVQRAHAVMHRGMFAHSRITPGALEMRALAPGVILVVATGGIEGAGAMPDGGPYEDAHNIMTTVMVKTAEGWRIAHAHNTTINPHAASHDPADAPTGAVAGAPAG